MTTQYESYDERLAKLVHRAHNACCDGPLEHELAREIITALIDLRLRHGRLAQKARGRLKDIRAKAAHIRHLTDVAKETT